MIELILKMLEITDSNHPNIQILKGKNKMPLTWKEGYKQYKMERNGNS